MLLQQIGACDDDEFGSDEPDGFHARILSQPVPDRHIDRLSLQIDRAAAGLHGNFNVRTALREYRKPRHQPGRRE